MANRLCPSQRNPIRDNFLWQGEQTVAPSVKESLKWIVSDCSQLIRCRKQSWVTGSVGRDHQPPECLLAQFDYVFKPRVGYLEKVSEGPQFSDATWVLAKQKFQRWTLASRCNKMASGVALPVNKCDPCFLDEAFLPQCPHIWRSD